MTRGNHIKPQLIGSNMIIKRIDSNQRRRADATTSYILDEPNEGEKVLFAGALNCFAENLDDAQKEMSADERAYSGSGDAVVHWVVSWREGEEPTPEQFQEFARDLLRDQGMNGHKAIIAMHHNTEHAHGHIALLRVKPEPEPNGKYKLQHYGAREKRSNGMNHEVNSARATVIDFAAKHGFTPDFEEITKPRHPDAIRLSQRIEASEAQNGQTHPKRLIGEKARDIIRAANSWDELHNNLIKHGISFKIEDNNDPEKYKQWGVLRGPENERIPLLVLPKDCSLAALEKRFGDQGRSSGEAPKTAASKGFYAGKLTAGKAKSQARKIFNAAGSLEEAERMLGEKGMTLERQGKTGCYLRYGEGGDQKMKLSALGGKYSLSALHKRFNANSSPYASSMHEKQVTVNASSRKDASGHASTVQGDRAISAQERAEATADKAADASANAVQAGADGMDGFYELDFFEQISVLQRVGNAEAAARAAVTREQDEKRKAQAAEDRARQAEMALAMSQHAENKQLNDNEEKKMESFQLRILSYKDIQQAVAETITAAALQDFKRMAHGVSWINSALTRERTEYKFRDDVGISDVRGVIEAAQNVSVFAVDTSGADADTAAELRDLLSKALGELRDEVQKLSPNASTTIDTAADKKAGAGSGKAPSETGLKSNETAQALQEKENQTPRRKFSFGSMFGGGKKFGSSSGPAGSGPKM